MRADHARNRCALVEAAADVFRDEGPTASLEDIARRAGLGSATLHRHFAGRSALIAAVYELEVRRLAAAAADSGGGDLWSWLDALVRHCAEERALLIALGPLAPGPESWEPLRAAARPLVERAHRDGGLRSEVGEDELLGLVDAVARTTAGDATAAARLFAVVRRGSRPDARATP